MRVLQFPWAQLGLNQRLPVPIAIGRVRCAFALSGNMWAQLGLNQRLPDYESGALTN